MKILDSINNEHKTFLLFFYIVSVHPTRKVVKLAALPQDPVMLLSFSIICTSLNTWSRTYVASCHSSEFSVLLTTGLLSGVMH